MGMEDDFSIHQAPMMCQVTKNNVNIFCNMVLYQVGMEDDFSIIWAPNDVLGR